jgi:hypothetical protein
MCHESLVDKNVRHSFMDATRVLNVFVTFAYERCIGRNVNILGAKRIYSRCAACVCVCVCVCASYFYESEKQKTHSIGIMKDMDTCVTANPKFEVIPVVRIQRVRKPDSKRCSLILSPMSMPSIMPLTH